MLREHEIEFAEVLSAPTIPKGNGNATKRVFVLTQERFSTLLIDDVALKLTIDAIIVDEAHEIGERERGVTLERVLDVATTRFPDARLFFSSPLRSDPEFLLKLFGRTRDAEHFIERVSPVSQNIINVYTVKNKPTLARMELALDEERIPLGEMELGFKFRQSYMGHFALRFTLPDDNAIIYCNWPRCCREGSSEYCR